MLRVITSDGEVFAFCSNCVPGIQYVQTAFELWQPVVELSGRCRPQSQALRCVRCGGPLETAGARLADDHAA